MKRVGGTTRPSRIDINKIPYDYAVEVMNGFMELDLVDKGLEELWMEVRDNVQEAMIKPSPRKEMKKDKMVV